jgi:uncharacterized membrane protein
VAVSRSLDRTFRVTLVLKGIDGALELLGGLALLAISPRSMDALVRALTQHELSSDPDDFVATHILHATSALTHGTRIFAAMYLLGHGVSKVALVVAVLRRRLWAYPAMIVLLVAFVVYQLYRLAVRFTVGLTLLTVFDAFVAWLTWQEYQAHRAGPS